MDSGIYISASPRCGAPASSNRLPNSAASFCIGTAICAQSQNGFARGILRTRCGPAARGSGVGDAPRNRPWPCHREGLSRSPVLPVPFGTLFSSPRVLGDFLELNADLINGFFEYAADCEEWGIKALLDREKLEVFADRIEHGNIAGCGLTGPSIHARTPRRAAGGPTVECMARAESRSGC